VVSHRFPTAEAQFPAQFSPCAICGGQSGIGTGLYPSSSVLPYKHRFTAACMVRGMDEEALEAHFHGDILLPHHNNNNKVYYKQVSSLNVDLVSIETLPSESVS
jgi:hypothetical protein